MNCKWLFKVKNKTKHPSWPIPGYVYNTGQQKGMKGDLIGPFAMHVCAPFWPSSWRQWPYCLKHAGTRDSPTGLLSQMTVQFSEVQLLLTHQVQDWPGTCHCHFHALDTWSLLCLWVYDHRYHSPLNRNHLSSLSCSQEQGSHPHKPPSERVSFTG